MPSPLIDQLTKAQDLVLETLEQVQEPVVKLVGSTAESAERYVPEMPAAPYGEKIPRAQELISTQYEFALKLLELNKRFAEALVDAAKPVADKVVVIDEAKPAKATKKAA